MPLFTDSDVQLLGDFPVLAESESSVLYNPPKSVQERFVGISFHAAYKEAADFLNYVFEHGAPTKLAGSRILDFGCGWGRMLRLLRRNPAFAEANLFGCDALDVALETCRRSLPNVWLTRTNLYPPSDYRSSFFDLIYAYSVFSHLSPECHLAWAQEYARILKPGGKICVTTRSKIHLDFCDSLRQVDPSTLDDHCRGLASSFADPNVRADYDAGVFLYAPLGGGDNLEAWAYGEAIVPRQFFESHWSRFGFRLLAWEDGSVNLGGQTRVVLERV